MKNILLQGCLSYGLVLPETAPESFLQYYRFMDKKNKVTNLTAISGEKDVAELHFLDSLALLQMMDIKEKAVIDIGSGAGFPGLPLKLAEPTMRLTLLDAQQKRIEFLQELCKTINVTDVTCLHARAEEAALLPDMRDNYDFAVSRAVARLNVLCELCLPFVKLGGCFVAMKGTDSGEEIKEAELAVEKLGAQLERIVDYDIPGTNVRHRAVILRKISATPEGFPRRFAKIQKCPL